MGCIIQGDALEVLKTLATNSVDSIVSDPPSSTGFMGMEWDKDKGGRDVWIAWLAEILAEARRVLKPGGHVLIWSLPRTSHYTAMALENAGYCIKDCVSHIFGEGMPKSHNVSKVLEKQGYKVEPGLGTGLKPAHELWWLARAPLAEDSIAANVLEWGVGAINIDATRIATGDQSYYRTNRETSGPATNPTVVMTTHIKRGGGSDLGRWPSNLLLSHTLYCQPNGLRKVKGNAPPGKPSRGQPTPGGVTYSRPNNPEFLSYNDAEGMEVVEDWICSEDCPIRLLDEQSGHLKTGNIKPHVNKAGGGVSFLQCDKIAEITGSHTGDQGGASRYFQRFYYCAKAKKKERNAGCQDLPARYTATMNDGIGAREHNPEEPGAYNANNHPTVKPLGLMKYLVKLITPPGGAVLDMFAGSGTTLVACVQEGFSYIGIEQKAEYVEIARARIAYATEAA